jgi:hypothetical protein
MGPFGCTLNLAVTDPSPSAPGVAPQTHRVASVRMSVEHLKTMAFLLARQVKLFERSNGVSIGIPVQVLNQMSISPEDWKDFWE